MDLVYLIRAGLGIPDYWHPHLEIQRDFLSGTIGRYPIAMDTKADYPGRLGKDGVPLVFYSEQAVGGVSPVSVVLYGIGSHDVFMRTHEERYRKQMTTCVLSWLENHCASLGDGIGWPSLVDLPAFGLKAPWFSAIVQGLALSLFVRACQLEEDARWLRLARQTWLGFRVPVQKGGFCREIDAGIVFEEYPSSQLDCVFNGMCHALVGLWEAWQSGVVGEAEEDFNRGVAALRSCLPRFDVDRWSLYSLNPCLGKPLLASPYYHRANGLLAQVISLMAGASEFAVYGQRWLESGNSILRRTQMALRIGFDRYRNAPELLGHNLLKRN
jgi:heparosan-N-sulfate-glucuronate 5-epimerase